MFEILGKYVEGDWEVLDTADERSEAHFLLAEYRLAFGPGWDFNVVERGE